MQGLLFIGTSPSRVSASEQSSVINGILELYPNVPALGSPFGTGNETFGLDPVYKQASAILGDLTFTSLRRQLAQVNARHGTKTYAYLFTDPQSSTSSPSLGGEHSSHITQETEHERGTRFLVPHASEVAYVYGNPQNGPASVTLSQNMIDYWVSFATSLDPNDGHGNTTRKY